MLSQQASSRKDPDSEREVFRSAGSMVLSWAWFVVAVIILMDLAVQGRDHAALLTAALVLAITGVVYACAWRPKIVADSSGITVINPVRDHQVPWAAVTKVDVVNAVRVHCEPAPGAARGKVLYSWAVQSSPRSARKASLRREVPEQPRPRLTPRPGRCSRRPARCPRVRGAARAGQGRAGPVFRRVHRRAPRRAGAACPAGGAGGRAAAAADRPSESAGDRPAGRQSGRRGDGRRAGRRKPGRPVTAGRRSGPGCPSRP